MVELDKKLPKIKIPKGPELRSRLFFSAGVIMLIYMLIATFQALWQNYRLDRELAGLREQNAQLSVRNQYLRNVIAYRKTDSYKDKEAREKLNYQKIGETVLIVPQDAAERFDAGNAKRQPQAGDANLSPSNPEKWWGYFFGQA